VTDTASLLSEPTRAALDARLEAFQSSSGHELLVWIAPTASGLPPEDFAVMAFKAWRVGRAGLDDGIVLFLFVQDHQARIEVGYGLEGVVTDAQSARILRDVLAPLLRAGQGDHAVVASVDALVGLLKGDAAPVDPKPASHRWNFGWIVLYVLVGLGFLALLVTHPEMALFLLVSLMNNGSGRGGNSGGGRTGGGGRSGGGGASGSW
jgi:uncharacterized protein